MATKAHLEANARYLEKMRTLTIRVTPEEKERIKKAAERSSGGSVQAFVLQAVRLLMDATEDGRTLVAIPTEKLTASAKIKGIKTEEYINKLETK